jgi:hypothetical protein
MSFMFKGPASLTTGSVIDASTVTADNMTVDIDLGVTDDLTVGDDLTAKDIFAETLKFTGTGTVTSVNQGSAGDTGDGKVLATKSYVDDKHKVLTYATMSGSAFTAMDIGTTHVLFLDSTSNGSITLTFSPTWSSISDGHRIFIAWVSRLNGTSTLLKIDFGAGTIYGASNSLRYLNLNELHSNALLYYSSTSAKWYSIESNSATISN